MQAYPHLYTALATASAADATVRIDSAGLHSLETDAPAEFGGPGNKWSPETLFVAAIADCYILTFRSIARASKLDWLALDCKVEGTLDRVDNVTKFTHYEIRAKLSVATGTDLDKARHIMEKSEAVCLITNSLSGTKTLHAEVMLTD
ncbi:MAG: OsmC family protein [Xanthomonadales bacterium]|nr:OsmC family protein [Xanthomonadales bacterium]